MRPTTVLTLGSIIWALNLCLATAEEPRPLPVSPPGPYWRLGASAHAQARSFAFGQPAVGTSYFYWYDTESNGHLLNADGSDALTTHPADMSGLSFRKPSWHKRQLEDMIAAGIDFLMPVFWGEPGFYELGQHNGWSFAGLPPLVEAHGALIAEGKTPPQIGLFFDTSVLQFNAWNADGASYHVDLTTESGKRWFYTVIRDFFSMIPPEKWARVDGKPIIFLYAGGFAKAQDPEAIPFARAQFAEEFGCEPFIVKMRDWEGEADAVYMWGGAVNLMLDRHVAAIGPGYDHSAVPGRAPVVVDRRDGETYITRWKRLLEQSPERRPWLIHVETWSEWHEGTDIADSREYGRHYIVLTKLFADMWRARQRLLPSGPYVNEEEVRWQEGISHGVSMVPSSGDGFWKQETVAARLAAITAENEVAPEARYLYFDVDDGFALDLDGGSVALTIDYLDDGCESFAVEYDSTNANEGVYEGAFRHAAAVSLAGSGEWKTVTVALTECWFANRANGADFRFAVIGGPRELAVSGVCVARK